MANKLSIFVDDLFYKGLFWSIVHRIYKKNIIRKILEPIVNSFKPDSILVNDFKIYVHKSRDIVSEWLIIRGIWSEEETEVFKKYIKPGDTVIDAGAHIGYFSLLASRLVGKNGKVYAFEPNPENFKLLSKNIKVNKINNITAINKALSEKNEKLKMQLSEDNFGDHRVYKSNGHKKNIKINAIKLDEAIPKSNTIDFMKIDIQGFEPFAIKGGMKLISRSKNMILLTEISNECLAETDSNIKDYKNILKKAGFKKFKKVDKENFLCLKLDKHVKMNHGNS